MKVFLSIMILFFSLLLQGQDYFNVHFDFNIPGVWDGASNALELDDGYIINGGTGHTLNPSWNSLAMTKLNYQGEIIWRKYWEDSTFRLYYSGFGSLIQDGKYFYTIGGKKTFYEEWDHDEMMLIKYNSDFDTLWSVFYGEKSAPYDTAYIARSFVKTGDRFIVTGTKYPDYAEDHQVFLLKMDTLGNVLWEQNFGNKDFHHLGYSVITTSDGGFAVGGYKFIIGQYGSPIGDPIVIKTDSLGNFEWEINLGGPYQDATALVCNTSDGNIMVASRYDTDSNYYNRYISRIQLTKLNNSGEIIWSGLYGDKSDFLSVPNIRPADTNGFIVCGYLWPIIENERGFLFRFNSQGDSLWYRQYASTNGQGNLNYFSDAIPTTDGGFLAAGKCIPIGSETGSQDAWVIKVDSLGCEGPWDCWVDIEEIEDESINFKDDIKIYPNPATNRINIEVDGTLKSVVVYDINGRIQAVEFIKPDLLDISLLKKGMYFIMINQRQGIKFIKN